MFNLLKFFITNSVQTPEINETRETTDSDNRDMQPVKSDKLIMESFHCPYCGSTKFVKRGFRQKLREKVQLYLCAACQKTFTQNLTKGKRYPMDVVLDAVSIYNLGWSLEKTCEIMKNRTGISIPASSLTDWLSEFSELCRFSRMREFALKKFSPKDMVITATLAHRQLYRFRFHRAKCNLMIQEEMRHRKFESLKEFLEMVPVECPHQYFQKGLRASEAPLTFSKKQMIVRSKQNYATRLAAFVLQSVKTRKSRHEAIQKFMLCNDSVTVATEVPVYLTREDIEHMQSQLGFQIYTKKIDLINLISNSPKKIPSTNDEKLDQLEIKNSDLPKLITGHIDFLQIRNGQIHILDYKPNAAKEQPIEQLTLYAMALSRLTGLRLFEFKCAWFDEKDYFEFYPLHVLHKPQKNSRRRKIITDEGVYKINQDREKILSVRPISI